MKDVSAYLERIGYYGSLEPNIDTLRAVHRAHLFRVPFENLSIHYGQPIRLDEDALFDKIVRRRHGGFCYELNGLFARLLAELGYGVTLLNAQGVNDDGSYAMEFDHLALLVACPGDGETRWLADVGFGDGPLEPLRLVTETEQSQGDRAFKIRTEGSYLLLTEQVVREEGRREWIKHYVFTLQPHEYADFFAACQYHSTSPKSMFTQKRLCTLFLPDGRVTLSERQLILTRDGVREAREIREDEVPQVLKTYFDVILENGS